MKNETPYLRQIQELDQLIRKGQQGAARERLMEMNFQKIPREFAADFADLARRLNMPKLILVLLKPFIYRESLNQTSANLRERALYATGLSRLGVFSEAQDILKKIKTEKNPEALLFLAQNLMLQWDYLAAIPKLKKYLLHPDVTPYMKLVGKVNLASCQVGEMKWVEANRILEELLTEIESAADSSEEKESLSLLHANVLGLMAHSFFLQGELDRAQKSVQEAKILLEGSRSRYELLSKKWDVVISLFQNPQSLEANQNFQSMKKEAVRARDWETIRDFEFYEALSRRDDALFLRLYHGTPYTSFRKRIKKIYQPSIQIPRLVDWQFSGSETSPTSLNEGRIFDLSKGCEDGGKAALVRQPILFRLLQTLTKDFFRPLPLGSVFAALYPDEKFNPETSPNRVYQVVKRLRRWLEEQEIPLEIEMQNDLLRLHALKPYTMRISFQSFNATRHDALFETVQRQFGKDRFTVADLMELCALTTAQARKFLTWALERRKLRRLKAGPQPVFVLP